MPKLFVSWSHLPSLIVLMELWSPQPSLATNVLMDSLLVHRAPVLLFLWLIQIVRMELLALEMLLLATHA